MPACRGAGGRPADRRSASIPLRATRSRPCDGVVSSSRPRGTSTRLTSDSQRAVSATCSITSLAHTTSNETSSNGSGPSIGASLKSSSGWPARARSTAACATSTPIGRRAHPRELGREPAVAAPEIQDAVSGPHAGAQVGEPQVEIGRLEILG